jgi:23S rRNA (guanosine2251-2'-O)-methyltransferase
MEQAGKSRSRDEWIYGLNPVLEVLRSGREIKSVFISSSRKSRFSEISEEIISRGIRLRKAENSFFDRRFSKGHQGIAALVPRRGYSDLDELLGMPSHRGETPLFLILDCIEDPRNFGAILRVADAGGVHGVIIQSHRSARLSPVAVKASSGASEHVPVARVPNIKHSMRDMKYSGLNIVGAEAGGNASLWDRDLTGPLAIVMGAEGKGLRTKVKENCDVIISLPMKGRINSLNVSVAAGIVIFEVMRQRMSGLF